MPSRNEEREALRARRLAVEQRERQEERRRLRIGYGVAALIATPVIAGIAILILSGGGGSSSAAAHIDTTSGATNGIAGDSRQGSTPSALPEGALARLAAKAGCRLRLGLAEEGRTHLEEGAPAPTYHTNPPTSGNHSSTPQADGAYGETPSFLNAVHSLEHGRVEIQYSPDLKESQQLALKGIFDQSPAGVLFFPNSKSPYQVAETAWTNLVACKDYRGSETLAVLSAFRDHFRGQGPEKVAIGPGA